MTAGQEVIQTIKSELSDWNVTYEFGQGGRHPYVRIVDPTGSRAKVSFAGHATGRNLLNVRAHVRQALRRLKAERVRGKQKVDMIDSFKPEEPPEPIEIVRPAQLPQQVRPERPLPTTAEVAAPDAPQPQVAADARYHHDEGKRPPEAAVRLPDRKPRDAFVKLTFRELGVVTNLVIANATYDVDARTFVWHEGWSDARVAKILASEPERDKIGPQHVANFRREAFGLLEEERPKPPPPSLEDLQKTIAEQQRQIAELMALVTAPKANGAHS